MVAQCGISEPGNAQKIRPARCRKTRVLHQNWLSFGLSFIPRRTTEKFTPRCCHHFQHHSFAGPNGSQPYIYISPFPTSSGHCRKLSYLKEGKKERHPSATAKKSKQVVAVKCRKSKQDDLKTNQRKAHLSASKPIYIQQDKVFRSVYRMYIYIYI